ncbi:MAG TPA: UbiX family flavin prenyltransferase [Hyphomicrobiales bacterium]|nr:UbiX family flavin prenyltransferase [Hyphomicrobiales bacterium]
MAGKEDIMTRPLVIGLTGATGMIYGVEMLKVLHGLSYPTELILSDSAKRNIQIETDYSLDEVCALAGRVHSNKDMAAAVSSGSYRTCGMVVTPCSIKTLSGIANSYNTSLITRAADVSLKEKRRLVLMVRETPLHKGHLELMARAADLGATILPPMPAFYHKPATILDLVHQSIGKALDQFDIEHNLFARWEGPEHKKEREAGDGPKLKSAI